MTVDDLVSPVAAERLGEGVLPTAAILIVQTISEEGPGLRYVRCEDLPTWQAIGMVRSAQLHLEADDLAVWEGDADDP